MDLLLGALSVHCSSVYQINQRPDKNMPHMNVVENNGLTIFMQDDQLDKSKNDQIIKRQTVC
jgi:hypothetical protein